MDKVVSAGTRGDLMLEDGEAFNMGRGIWIIDQREADGTPHRVVIDDRWLAGIRHGDGSDLTLDNGEAHNMGEGIWIAMQRDEAVLGRPIQSVVITANDVKTMLTALAA